MTWSCLVLVLAASAPRTSFNDASARVFASPLDSPVPSGRFPEAGLVLDVNAVLASLGRIVRSPADFRENTRKVVHRWGVCAEATWEIDAPSAASGLFSYGTRIPAIVRFAVGSNRTVHLAGVPRAWGLAIKLFPARDPALPVETANLVLFDQYGLDGQARPHFLQPLQHDPPIHFTSHIRAASLISNVPRWVLSRYDDNPLYRSLAPLAEVDMDGARPFSPRTPEVVQLHARHSAHQEGALPADYRDELRAYAPGELVLDIVLPPQPLSPGVTRVGSLRVGRMVLSETCDGALQFWHPPVPRAR